VSKPKAQGTQWESELVRRIQDAGLVAGRHAEGGTTDVADVWIGSPVPEGPDMTVLAWKRLTGDGDRRTPDGERDVVVLRTYDFLRLVEMARIPFAVHVECKATQALNVTRVLYRARGKVAKAIRRREAA
jgi:hypothetical protein